MNLPTKPDFDLEKRLSARLLDVFIRTGLVFAMAVLCYQIFSPFVSLMAWALILAVTLYPAHQKLARRMEGKQGLAATLLVLGGIVLIGGAHDGTDGLAGRFGSVASSAACATTPCRFPHPRRALPSGRSSARRSMVYGRRPIRICRQSFRACSRRSATCPSRRWRWLPASAARCCCSWSPSSLPGSSWPLASQEPEAPIPSSIASSASCGANNSCGFPRRRFVRWHWVCSGWPSSRPSSSV